MSKRGLAALSVLLIDDNHNMLALLRTILQGLGITEISEAADPADGFERFRHGSHDVIFVDLKMPVLDGAEFIRLVRNAEDSPNPYVPIIVVSAYSEKRRVIEARDAGATEFVRKPLTANDIYAKLRAVIERPRPFVKAKSYFGPDRRRHSPDDYKGSERREDGERVAV